MPCESFLAHVWWSVEYWNQVRFLKWGSFSPYANPYTIEFAHTPFKQVYGVGCKEVVKMFLILKMWKIKL
jgi:hypothetical protein